MKPEAERQVDGPAAVSFDAYLNRDVSTRSGAVGVLDGERLKDTGFGVLAFLFSLLLKKEDRAKGYGLELPNIRN